MKSDTVVGYTYKAEIACPACITETMAGIMPGADGDRLRALADEFGVRECAEAVLAVSASMLDIDRENESSFDSDDFPKVIFADQAYHETCDGCQEDLL